MRPISLAGLATVTALFCAAPVTGVASAAQGDVTVSRVTDVSLGGPSGDPSRLIDVNGTVYFAGDDGTNGRELWKSDGTAAGTRMVKDINTAAGASSDPAEFVNVGGTLFFTADDGTSGREVWKSDGSAAGTTLVKDVNPDAAASTPRLLTEFNGALFFWADDGTHSEELWRSDGTADGTTRLTNIAYDSAGFFLSLNMAHVGGLLYFAVDNGAGGSDLWTTDGTPGNTHEVPAPIADNSVIYQFTPVGTSVYFNVPGYVFASDGTAAGTGAFGQTNGGFYATPEYLTGFDGKVFFAGPSRYQSVKGYEPYTTAPDFTTPLFKDINTVPDPNQAVVGGDAAVLPVEPDRHRREPLLPRRRRRERHRAMEERRDTGWDGDGQGHQHRAGRGLPEVASEPGRGRSDASVRGHRRHDLLRGERRRPREGAVEDRRQLCGHVDGLRHQPV
jgi:ELWxxDGT repeat protein